MTIQELGLEVISRRSVDAGYSCTYRVLSPTILVQGQILRDEDINRQVALPENIQLAAGETLNINYH